MHFKSLETGSRLIGRDRLNIKNLPLMGDNQDDLTDRLDVPGIFRDVCVPRRGAKSERWFRPSEYYGAPASSKALQEMAEGIADIFLNRVLEKEVNS